MSESDQNSIQESASGAFAVRAARPADFDTIIAVVDDWWGRPASRDWTRVFVDHFFGISLIAEREGELAGFLIGFLSPAKPENAYIHFLGVAPEFRRDGLVSSLYGRFFETARQHRRTRVKAITSPQNARSIAFQRSGRPLSQNFRPCPPNRSGASRKSSAA